MRAPPAECNSALHRAQGTVLVLVACEVVGGVGEDGGGGG